MTITYLRKVASLVAIKSLGVLLAYRACERLSHCEIFHWSFRYCSVKIIFASVIECVWKFRSNVLWDTH